MALVDDRNLLLQRRSHLHAFGGARLSSHGPGRRLLQAHGGNSSKMADTSLQLDWSRDLVRGTNTERQVRPAVHVRHIRNGAFVHTDRDRHVLAALEAARNSAALSR